MERRRTRGGCPGHAGSTGPGPGVGSVEQERPQRRPLGRSRSDAQPRAARSGPHRIRTAVTATNTSLTGLFGVGPFVAAIIIGHSGDISRFRSRDHYAAYTGTAPIEVSSGGRVVHRLSRRGNRKLNHALHIAAVSQIRHRNSQGRALYDRKIAEGKTNKEALRALKRRISDAVYRQLQADAR